MKKTKAIRQGDVIIKRRDKLPEGVTKLDHLVLAEGEITNHRHVVTIGEAVLYKLDNVLWLDVKSKTATVTHEEHGPVEVERGVHEILIQREYSPAGNLYVQD